ncbi:phosphotransferase enzyme family protein [Nonomuraea sp. NPDC050536]|uniref:phosphotransferase enzyme family protein n=1 Tax=Nonomuraea sp. NPDC050536 TaxID=3364366 RepID=UPI0037CA60D1
MDLDFVREAYGWASGVVVAEGPRGALGRIWRVEIGAARYALKEIFFEPPTQALIEAELAFARRAAGAGVRMPGAHPAREGRYLVEMPDGTWARLYDWVDLRASGAEPEDVGALLARMHRCAPALGREIEGGTPARWYDRVPAEHEWAEAAESGAEWAPRLTERLATLPELCAAVTPVDPAGLILCHRDLHPENVQADPSGALVVLDWDNLGPAEPGRELGRALFDWFGDDLDGMRRMYQAYVCEGGPGRIATPADFSMMLACRLNFLLVQTRAVRDPQHREWAEREIDEALDTLPTPRRLAEVLVTLTRE